MKHRTRLVAPVVDGVPHAWLRVPLNDDWVAEHRLAIQGGRVVVAAIRVYPTSWIEGFLNVGKTPVSEELAGLHATVPPGGLRRTVLRRVKVGALVDASEEVLGGLRRMLVGASGEVHTLSQALRGLPPPLDALSPLDTLLERPWGARPSTRPRAPDAKRPGRRPLGDEVLLEAAAIYARAWRAWKQGGPPPQPSAARTLKMSEPRMRDLVYRARRRGFLPRTTQGLGGGDLTPEARTLLRKLHRQEPRRWSHVVELARIGRR